jgi:hypothetical protein
MARYHPTKLTPTSATRRDETRRTRRGKGQPVAVTAFDDDDVPRHDVPRDGRSGFVVIEGRQVHYLE